MRELYKMMHRAERVDRQFFPSLLLIKKTEGHQMKLMGNR